MAAEVRHSVSCYFVEETQLHIILILSSAVSIVGSCWEILMSVSLLKWKHPSDNSIASLCIWVSLGICTVVSLKTIVKDIIDLYDTNRNLPVQVRNYSELSHLFNFQTS